MVRLPIGRLGEKSRYSRVLLDCILILAQPWKSPQFEWRAVVRRVRLQQRLDERLEVLLFGFKQDVSLWLEEVVEFGREDTWAWVYVDQGASLMLL